MTLDQFNAQVQADIVRMMRQTCTSEEYILDHISADCPCSFEHIDLWVKYQLPDDTETGEILQTLIDNGEITFCHSSQTYSVA